MLLCYEALTRIRQLKHSKGCFMFPLLACIVSNNDKLKLQTAIYIYFLTVFLLLDLYDVR